MNKINGCDECQYLGCDVVWQCYKLLPLWGNWVKFLCNCYYNYTMTLRLSQYISQLKTHTNKIANLM